MRSRLIMLLASLLWVVGAALPTAGTAAAQGTSLDFPIANGHFYTQANGQGGAGGLGFAVTDDGGIPFWSEFQRLGGVAALGYPISGRFSWDGFTVQATQRVVMQWRPELKQVLFVNTYDRMHDLGKDPWLQAYRNTPPPLSTSPDTGLTFNQVKARHLAFLDSDPAIKAKYFATASIGDPIIFNGLPMTTPVNEGPFVMVRCQRITIQRWLVDSPASGAHKGDVVVTLGGDDAKASGVLPDKAALQPVAPPAGVTPGPAPSTSGFIYGMQAHQYNGQEAPVQNAISGAGFGWVKQQVEWRTIQPDAASQQNWGELDQIVNSSSAHGLKILLSIVQAPLWARSNPDPAANQPYPKNPADLARFMGLLATHYKGKVGAYEVWNEENFAREVGPGNINAGNYVELLKASFTAIRAADPNALVVSGAPTPTGVNDPNIAFNDATYFQQMFAYQGGVVTQYFDILGAHAEPWANPPDATVGTPEPANVTGFNNHPSFFFRRLEDYRSAMVAAGASGKKIWETEFGYDSCDGAGIPAPPGYEYCKWVSEQQQAAYLVGAFNYAHAHWPWLGGIFVWNLNFQAQVPPADEKWGFGILRADFSPRPAYTALQQMAKT